MMTVKEVSDRTGVSIRTLQYYDRIGLLSPAERTEAGYRLYDDEAIRRLSEILLFRELEFPLKDIRRILESPDYDREKALRQQITLLELKKERLENLILYAREIRSTGGETMRFDAFDTEKIDAYAAKAKAEWGGTPEYGEFTEKDRDRTEADRNALSARLMDIFREFSEVKREGPASENAQALVKKLQDFITANYYTCSDQVLRGLGMMYGAGGEFTENIDAAAGEGTAAFAAKAIEAYCSRTHR